MESTTVDVDRIERHVEQLLIKVAQLHERIIILERKIAYKDEKEEFLRD